MQQALGCTHHVLVRENVSEPSVSVLKMSQVSHWTECFQNPRLILPTSYIPQDRLLCLLSHFSATSSSYLCRFLPTQSSPSAVGSPVPLPSPLHI